MDSRAEFESEWSKRFSDHKLARRQTMGGDLHDEYRDSRVNYAWIMWQASRQALNGEATGTLTVDHHKNDPTMQNVDYEHADGVLEPGVYKLYTHPTSADAIGRLKAGSVPEGYALVPKMMTLDFKAMERLLCMTGEDFMEDEFPECILWVGETIDDDGKVDTYGLNIACSECMEEGSVSVIEFANPVVTGAGDGVSVPDRRGAGQAEGDA